MIPECSNPDDCKDAIERLYHFLDGELTDERRSLIATHLDECGYCLDAYGFEGELRNVIALKCKDRVPETLMDRVADAIRQETVGHPPL